MQAEVSFNAFDTSVKIRAFGEEERMKGALHEAHGFCMLCESLFSRTLPSSDIAHLNQARGAWVDVHPFTQQVLEAALRYCAASEGAFDITIGSATRLWDLKRGIMPDAAALTEAVRHVDWRSVQVDEGRARLEDPEAAVDLGGIAKGWIADEVGARLAAAGASGYVVDLGGNVLVGGEKPDGRPWAVAVRDPSGSRAPARTITLRRGSVVTSGTYERCCVVEGVRCHHILDPTTGMPVRAEYRAATVVCDTSLDAEGFSTTLLALGPERARALQRTHPEILQVYFTR